ncbi:MAG: hypothetical protein JST84_18430 [Acidobacteria bacterium]|nr:hypothetical protein [Acidobacteriota bacterium]
MLNHRYIEMTTSPGFQLSSVHQEYSRRVEVSYPGVKVARDVTFDDIWNLFLESGFLYPEKVARLESVLPEIQQTVRALLRENGKLTATVALREAQMLEAHMNILRWYENTWIVQHLAALPMSARTNCASARLTLGFTFYGRLRPDIVWSKMYFRPNNPWPARVFGGYARRINDPQTSDLRTFHYLVAATTDDSPKSLTGIEVYQAGEEDRGLIEDWFTMRGRTTEVQANQLQASDDGLANLSRAYEQAGLMRRRESLIAARNGRVTGFALLEIASLGMNFSELTNAFTVHLMDDTDAETRLALVESAKQRYAELGRAQCIALEEGDDLTSYEAAGFSRIKDYTCWTFHREHLAGMEEYFLTLFGARSRRGA